MLSTCRVQAVSPESDESRVDSRIDGEVDLGSLDDIEHEGSDVAVSTVETDTGGELREGLHIFDYRSENNTTTILILGREGSVAHAPEAVVQG